MLLKFAEPPIRWPTRRSFRHSKVLGQGRFERVDIDKWIEATANEPMPP